MIPLDIVQIDTGSVGMVKETNNAGAAAILWFGDSDPKFAWWEEGEKGLIVIDNLPASLCRGLEHPFASSKKNPYAAL